MCEKLSDAHDPAIANLYLRVGQSAQLVRHRVVNFGLDWQNANIHIQRPKITQENVLSGLYALGPPPKEALVYSMSRTSFFSPDGTISGRTLELPLNAFIVLGGGDMKLEGVTIRGMHCRQHA